MRTSNNGLNWTQITSPTSRTIRDISDFYFMAVGDSGVTLKSTDYDLTWFQVLSPVTARLNAVNAVFNPYAVVDNGAMIHSTNYGMSWLIANSGTSQNLYGLPLFASFNIAVGAGGLIWRSTNFGANWFAQNSGTTNDLKSVEFSTGISSRIYVVGANGTILKTTNDGAEWGFQQSSTTQNLNSIFFYLNDNTGYAAGANGTIVKTTNGGGTIYSSIIPLGNNLPLEFRLYQNYPNPFNPVTEMKFDVNIVGQTSLSVYDILDREVETLVSESLNPGTYEIQWDGSNFPSEVYYYRLTSGGFSQTKRMVLIK